MAVSVIFVARGTSPVMRLSRNGLMVAGGLEPVLDPCAVPRPCHRRPRRRSRGEPFRRKVLELLPVVGRCTGAHVELFR
jgi:hypothetical protein